MIENNKINCTVEILTRNSAATLERCLQSVKDFAETIVLDGNSTDSTLEIAKRYGCRIVRQYDTDEPSVAIKDYSEVRNKGLRLAAYCWFMFIDSDEYLSEEAVEEIRSIVTGPNPKAYIWWQPRKYVLDGKIIECASTYPNQQIRLFHKKWVKEFIKPIHERIEIRSGASISTLENYEYVPLGALAELKIRWKHYIEKEIAMNTGRSHGTLLRLSLRSFLLFGLYFLRYVRNLFACRGARMPLSYEFARHSYLLEQAVRLLGRSFLF